MLKTPDLLMQETHDRSSQCKAPNRYNGPGEHKKTCTRVALLSNALLAISTELDLLLLLLVVVVVVVVMAGAVIYAAVVVFYCIIYLIIYICYILLWLLFSLKHGPKYLWCCSPPGIRDESCGKFHV